MKRISFAIVMFAFTAGALLFAPGAASADEVKMVAVITKIDIAGPDAKTATATLKNVKNDEEVTVVVNDELTLDKFKDHRIVVGDEIRLKYEVQDGKNISRYFRKTAGC